MELEVHWAGEKPMPVGRLYQDSRGAVFFEYDGSWRAGSRQLSPLYLSNETTGAVTTPTPGFGELHGLFQDALPDWWGERLMARHFEERGIPWKKVTALRKLACQGDRKMGALVFKPDPDAGDFTDGMVVELGELLEAAREAMRGESGHVLAELLKSGMTPGGAQPKALLSISHDFKRSVSMTRRPTASTVGSSSSTPNRCFTRAGSRRPTLQWPVRRGSMSR